MTDSDVVGLRALAEAVAVEGPWAIWHDLDYQGFKTVGDAESYRQLLADGEAEDCNPVAHVYTDPDAEFIAAASPDVVLALLDEITTLRAEVADRDARIADALDAERQEVTDGFAREWMRLILSAPAVPVPQDNPEAKQETNGVEQ
jgi:hypothetical protein